MVKKIFISLFLLLGLGLLLPNVFVQAAQTTVSTAPHWQSGSITVYVPQKEAKTAMVQHAFQKWERSSYGNLKFRFVEKEPAQITVEFVNNLSGSDGSVGLCNLSIEGNYITKANIKIVANNKNYSNDMVYTTMLHEIGHALGLNHNERKYRSIMHFPVDETQDILSIDVEKLFKINGWSWSQKNVNK